MTFIEKRHTGNGYHITVGVENNAYKVTVCRCYADYCGHPVREITYPINDKKRAYATYNRYIKKYTN